MYKYYRLNGSLAYILKCSTNYNPLTPAISKKSVTSLSSYRAVKHLKMSRMTKDIVHKAVPNVNRVVGLF